MTNAKLARYIDRRPGELLEEASNEAADPFERSLAVAGVLRALLNVKAKQRPEEYPRYVETASGLLLEIRAQSMGMSLPGVEPTEAESTPDTSLFDSLDNYVSGLPVVNGKLKGSTMAGIEANDPNRAAGMVLKNWGVVRRHKPRRSGILFMPLANGGVIAGADVYCCVLQQMGKSGLLSMFYPVRYSRYDSKDKTPVLAPPETSMIKSAVDDGLLPVVFDDVCSGGETVRRAGAYFSSHLVGQTVTSLTVVRSSEPSDFDPKLSRYQSSGVLHVFGFR